MPLHRIIPATAVAALALWMAAAGAACTRSPAVDSGPALVLEAVAPDVWRVPVADEESNPTNGGWVTQPVLVHDGARLWLIGSGPTPAQGLRLRCVIERQLHRRVTDIVNTRAHPELALANGAYPGARIWALHDVARAMRQRCPQCLMRLEQHIVATDPGTAGDRSLRDAAIRVPNHRLGHRSRPAIDEGSIGPFRWWALERAPGERTLVLQHRPSGQIVAQGLMWAGGVPNLRETAPGTLVASWQWLSALAQAGSGGVLGEQGGPGTAADIDSHLAYLSRLERLTNEALERGEVEGGVPIELAEFAGAPGYAAYHALNRQRVWREREQALFR